MRNRISLAIKTRSMKSLKKPKIVLNRKYSITLGEIKVSNVRLTALVRFGWLHQKQQFTQELFGSSINSTSGSSSNNNCRDTKVALILVLFTLKLVLKLFEIVLLKSFTVLINSAEIESFKLHYTLFYNLMSQLCWNSSTKKLRNV